MTASAPPPRLPSGAKDIAWVAVPARQSPTELTALLNDVEALFRINPYYVFEKWLPDGASSHRVELNNLSNDQRLCTDLEAAPVPEGGLLVTYRQGIKRRTWFLVEPAAEGSRLVVVDDYEGAPEQERSTRLAEVDKSLPAWGEALRLYLLRLRRWSWLPGWRWYLRRVWMRMQPSQRRIVWLISLITVAEFGFFLFVLLVYLIEQHR